MEKQEKDILNKEEYKKIVENTSDLITLTSFSINPVYFYLSPSHKKILGYSPSELIGKPSLELLHPDDKKKLFPLLKQYISAKAKKLVSGRELKVSEKIEYRFKDKSGNWHNLESTVNFLGNKLLFVSRDITERKRAERDADKLTAIIKYSSELVNLATLEGKMMFLNEAGSKMLGIDPKNVERHKILEVIPESYMGVVKDKLLPNIMNGGSWEGDLAYRNIKTGELTDVHVMAFAILDPNTNKPLHLANVSKDITERKRVEEEIKKRNIELEKANRLMIGRELKMMELKKRIKELEANK